MTTRGALRAASTLFAVVAKLSIVAIFAIQVDDLYSSCVRADSDLNGGGWRNGERDERDDVGGRRCAHPRGDACGRGSLP